jgi:hypothetical protein
MEKNWFKPEDGHRLVFICRADGAISGEEDVIGRVVLHINKSDCIKWEELRGLSYIAFPYSKHHARGILND